jgi:hypothetical protein
MKTPPQTRRFLRVLFIVCSFASLGVSLYTGDWNIFGAWWVVCLLIFAVCFLLALFGGRAHNGSGTSNENVR